MAWPARFNGTRIAAVLLLRLLLSQAQAADQAVPVSPLCFDSSDRVRLCYAAHLLDDAPKPILVFIPGWTMPAALWEKQLAYFAGKYSVVAFDPRGQGASATPDYGYTLERRVADIKDLLDRFPGRSFVLIGWSLAVFETLAYADQYGASRLSGLVLVDNSIGEGPDGPPRTGTNPFFAELRTRREETLRDFAAAIFLTDPGEAVRDSVLDSALKTDVEDSIRLLSYPKPRAYWRDAVYRFARPVLYLVTPKWAEQADALTQKHPQARAEIFDRSGHALFWDEADRFNRTLQAFVDTLDAQ